MPAPTILTPAELSEALANLPDWSVEGGKLRKTFVFADFSEAFGFMTRAALAAERMDHHPDWCNSYRTVQVDLVTHSAGGITPRDLALAQVLELLAAPLAPPASARPGSTRST